MRTYHGALLLVLAVVMAMLSTGTCTGTSPAPAPAPSSVQHPMPKRKCQKLFSNSGCDQRACNGNCVIKLKGFGVCLYDACWCYYNCKSQLPPPPRMAAW